MYAQNNEDEIVSRYFGGFKGTLLDIGANDGITLSNSRYLIERGWRGALVEPSPVTFQKLYNLYRGVDRVWLFNAAIADRIGIEPFHEMGAHLGKGDTALLSTLIPKEKERWPGTEFKEITVETATIQSMLVTSPYKKFDFISIDAEGFDLFIMGEINFDAMECRCLCVEFNGKDQDKFDSVAQRFGFRLYHKNSENLIYVR
jgi:FkbM family methyltransferase